LENGQDPVVRCMNPAYDCPAFSVDWCGLGSDLGGLNENSWLYKEKAHKMALSAFWGPSKRGCQGILRIHGNSVG